MSNTCFGQYYFFPSSGWIQILYRIIYCVVFSENCIQPDDGQKYYWPKHVVDVLCVIDNIVVL